MKSIESKLSTASLRMTEAADRLAAAREHLSVIIREANGAGLSIRAIGERIGMSHGQVHNLLHGHPGGVTRKRND